MSGERILHWFESYLSALSGSDVVTYPRVITAMLGMLVLVLVVMRFWERRMKVLPALLFGTLGLGLLTLALDTGLLKTIMRSSFLSRIRFLMGFLSVAVLAITFESIRISKLRERFALLWLGTGAMVLLAALFPETIFFLTRILGMQYVTAVAAAVFTFLLLVAFHFSIALSGLEDDRSKIAQRCAQIELRLKQLEAKISGPVSVTAEEALPESEAESRESLDPRQAGSRSVRGVLVSSRIAIGVAFLAVLISSFGMDITLTPETSSHFQVMEEQAMALPVIQSGGWHYLSALMYKLSDQNKLAVNVLQSIFWLQFLLVAYLWSTARRGQDAYSPLLFILVIASMPLNLVFPFAAYPDLALLAQLFTTFYLLDRKKILLASMFMLLAIWISDNGMLFAPPFFILGIIRCFESARLASESSPNRSKRFVVSLVFLPISFMAGLQLRDFAKPADRAITKMAGFESLSEYLLVNSGILFWLVVLAGLIGVFRPSGPRVLKSASRKHTWPLWVGVFVIFFILFRTGGLPNPRNLFLVIPFLVLPFSEWAMRISTRRILILATVIALVQGGLALKRIDGPPSTPSKTGMPGADSQ